MTDRYTLNFSEVFNVKSISSSGMVEAVTDWLDLYYLRNVPDEENPCQRLPVAIVEKLTKAVFSEYKAGLSKGKKSDYIESVLSALEHNRKKAMQQMLIGGSIFLKPVIGEKLRFLVIPRENYILFGMDEDGHPNDIGTIERTDLDGRYYTLFERRYINEAGNLMIDCRLYRSESKDTLGHQVSLDMLDKYAGIPPENELKGVHDIGLIYMRCPTANCVDGSEEAVSVYAAASKLIHEVNINEAQLSGEFDRGQSRILVSGDLLKRGKGGKKELKGNVFTALDEDPDSMGITIFSPAFREQSFEARRNGYLRIAENLIGLKRGILSDAEAVEKTATEITSSAGEYNLTVIDFQNVWKETIKNAFAVCEELYSVYQKPFDHVDADNDIAVSWGNGILYDEDKVWTQYLQMVSAGMLKPEIAVAWYFDEPWGTEEDLARIREKYMPALEQLQEDVGA